jgi:transcriptional regulator with PAS, ATPase and Fis domain
MIDIIKNKIWNLLKEKEVSLVMIYDIQGNILWHKGRPVNSKTVTEGSGFSKSYIKNAFLKNGSLNTEGLIISGEDREFSSESTIYLHIKSLIINPINNNFFLYIDSGIKKSFSQADCEAFRVLGEVLGDTIRRIKESEAGDGGITGSSNAIKKIKELAITYSMSDEPVLLTGETGTGKSHIAQLIHQYSGRNGQFKIIHTPGIPENLFESEMFGHKKGAFTDASTEKKGLVEEAAGGTLFIDEITEISVGMQAKLLRFIESGKYTPLGSTIEKEANVRVVAATNKNPKDAIKEKSFREDLYYRLNVFSIHLPPLRERQEDLRDLVQEKKYYLKGKEIGNGFWEAIYQHHWPGNIRELFSLLKRVGVHQGDVITSRDVRDIIGIDSNNVEKKEKTEEVTNLWYGIACGKSFWEVVKKPFLARDLKRSEVKSFISMGLEEAGGKYKSLIPVFNLKSEDYHRFMRFLHEQDLIPLVRSTNYGSS